MWTSDDVVDRRGECSLLAAAAPVVGDRPKKSGDAVYLRPVDRRTFETFSG